MMGGMDKDKEVTTATLATLTTTLAFMQSQMAEIRADVKGLINTFATKEELNQSIQNNQNRIVRLEAASNLWRWLSPTLSGIIAWVVGSAITFLLIQYLQQLASKH